MSELDQLFQHPHVIKGYLEFEESCWHLRERAGRDKEFNRKNLAHFFSACVAKAGGDHALVRRVFTKKHAKKKSVNLPSVIGEDGFLCYYARGRALSSYFASLIWMELEYADYRRPLHPIYVFWNKTPYHNILAAPPGFLSKFSARVKEYRDGRQLEHIIHDFARICLVEEDVRRLWMTMGVLASALVYRKIDGKTLVVPSLKRPGELIPYTCTHHLIENGMKTVSLTPQKEGHRGFYLCEGTTIWPSQTAPLGTVIANFAEHGAASAAYAHSWRRIHKHLRALSKNANGLLPIVAGHSLGGALATQISLYSPHLIHKAFAFNPPVTSERDYRFFLTLPKMFREKLKVGANIDDFAFWRIGARVIGEVTLFLGCKRWGYYTIVPLDVILFVPAVIKCFLNLLHAFPAHQKVLSLEENFAMVTLTDRERREENRERVRRFDYVSFFPRLYDPTRWILKGVRYLFGWDRQKEYLENELELITLHEKELLDSKEGPNQEVVGKSLEALKRERERILRKLKKI